MRISDWSSDVCSSDLHELLLAAIVDRVHGHLDDHEIVALGTGLDEGELAVVVGDLQVVVPRQQDVDAAVGVAHLQIVPNARSEERRVGKECVSTCSSRWSPYP